MSDSGAAVATLSVRSRGQWLAVVARQRELSLVAIMIVLAVVTTGTHLARRALVPIDRIVAQARQIGDSHLAGRLPHPGTAAVVGYFHDAFVVAPLKEVGGRASCCFPCQ